MKPRFLRLFMTVLMPLIFAVSMYPPSAHAGKPGKMVMKDVVVGTGAEAKPGTQVTVHYTGWLMDGTKFDSSHDRGRPFTFALGGGQVIPGWDQGVVGMKVGGKRELIIPPGLAYGARGVPGAIPPGATLKFEVELLGVKPPAYTNIDADTLKKLIARGVPVVDVRTAPEWKETGVIKGSNLIESFTPKGFNPNFREALAKVAGAGDEVILICQSGHRSRLLADALSTQMGYTKIYNVEHGIADWIKRGDPVGPPPSR